MNNAKKYNTNTHLEADGTIKSDANIDFIFRNATHKLKIANVTFQS